jgi:hypothetical protein
MQIEIGGEYLIRIIVANGTRRESVRVRVVGEKNVTQGGYGPPLKRYELVRVDTGASLGLRAARALRPLPDAQAPLYGVDSPFGWCPFPNDRERGTLAEARALCKNLRKRHPSIQYAVKEVR